MVVRNYANQATPQALISDVSAVTVTLPVASTTGYPTAPFLLVIERGTANEEVVLCTVKSANSFTVQRGFDETVGKTHGVGTFLEHCSVALDYREANTHVNTAHLSPTLVDAAGDLLVATGADTLDRFAISDAANRVLVAEPSVSQKMAYKDVGLGVWIPYTPNWFTNGVAPTLGNGTLKGRVCRMGQTVHFQMSLILGSSTYKGTGTWAFGHPITSLELVPREADVIQWGSAYINKLEVAMTATSLLQAAGITVLCPDNSPSTESAENYVSGVYPSNWVAGDGLRIWGTYETSVAVI